MITSSSNARIKQIRELNESAKARREAGLFVIEGEKLFAECPRELIESVFISEDFVPEDPELLSGLEVETVEKNLFTRVCDTKTPQGILAVVRMPKRDGSGWAMPKGDGSGWAWAKGEPPSPTPNRNRPFLASRLHLILETLQSPGNVGTIIRSAEAAGAEVILSADCADPFSPKVVRATMGSIFRVPFRTVDDLPAAVRELQQEGVRVFAARLDGSEIYTKADLSGDAAFLIGNEGKGLSEEISKLADAGVRIPMEGEVESLNAGIAAALLAFEARRQQEEKK